MTFQDAYRGQRLGALSCLSSKSTGDIVEAILDGKQGPEVTLARVLEPFPVEWERQQEELR